MEAWGLSDTGNVRKQNQDYYNLIHFGPECLLAIISLCAVAYVYTNYISGAAGYTPPTAIFAQGLSQMIGTIPGLGTAEVVNIAYSLLILAVSAFCLTSLDTATRIGRMMFQEMFTNVGEDPKSITGFRKYLVNPYVATVITVVLGVGLGMTGYSIIWPLFGAANQLLAALALLAVASFLKNIGRNNKMFYIPMVFMLIVTLTSLVITIQAKAGIIFGGGLTEANTAATFIQLGLGIVLVILAIILAVKGAKTLFGKKN